MAPKGIDPHNLNPAYQRPKLPYAAALAQYALPKTPSKSVSHLVRPENNLPKQSDWQELNPYQRWRPQKPLPIEDLWRSLIESQNSEEPDYWRLKNRPKIEEIPDYREASQKTAEYNGWANWETWNTALMADNDEESQNTLYQLVQRYQDPARLEQWLIENVIGPYNQARIKDAQEWNDIPQDERIDYNFEDLKERNPQAADIVDQLGFGADVSDSDPMLIDPRLVDFNEIYQSVYDDLVEDGELPPRSSQDPDQPGDFFMPDDWHQSKNATPQEQALLNSHRGSDLENLPGKVHVRGHGPLQFGSHAGLQRLANDYMAKAGLPYSRPTSYVPIDPAKAKQIAKAYDEMEHNPYDSNVAASYKAMADETMAQYKHLIQNGYRFEFYPQHDPYPNSPREAILDLHKNRHMYVYPTDQGFGDGSQAYHDHPLLAQSGESWNGRPVTYNDIFRAVHDVYGHAKEGVGFRHNGEDNAWRQHKAMYSPLAVPAMTSETRGQNSWVNFGPYGAQNQNANQEDTQYADQKTGILPEWTRQGSVSRLPHKCGLLPSWVWQESPHRASRLCDMPKTQDLNLGLNQPLRDFQHFVTQSGRRYAQDSIPEMMETPSGRQVQVLWRDDAPFVNVRGEWEPMAEWIYSLAASSQLAEYVPYPDFNEEFWASPHILYHGTTGEWLDQVKQEGLKPRNLTRGIQNRWTPAAVFTSDTPYVPNEYYAYDEGAVFAIDTPQMKADGYMPKVSQEEPIQEAEMMRSLAWSLGDEYFEPEIESGIGEDTIVIYGEIPPQYLSVINMADHQASVHMAKLYIYPGIPDFGSSATDRYHVTADPNYNVESLFALAPLRYSIYPSSQALQEEQGDTSWNMDEEGEKKAYLSGPYAKADEGGPVAYVENISNFGRQEDMMPYFQHLRDLDMPLYAHIVNPKLDRVLKKRMKSHLAATLKRLPEGHDAYFDIWAIPRSQVFDYDLDRAVPGAVRITHPIQDPILHMPAEDWSDGEVIWQRRLPKNPESQPDWQSERPTPAQHEQWQIGQPTFAKRMPNFKRYAADIQALARKAYESLMSRQDIMQLMNELNLWYGDPEGGIRYGSPLHDPNLDDASPAVQAYVIEHALRKLLSRYPESYKIWPWLVKQIKTDSHLGRARDNSHLVDIVGQAGKMIQDMRQNNRLPQGFDINQVPNFEALEQWLYSNRTSEDVWENPEHVYEFSDGWTIDKVSGENDLNREGELMGHCFVPGMLVGLSSNPIENCQMGDQVVDKTGKPTEVKSIWERTYDGAIKRIITAATLPIECTPEHLMLVLKPAKSTRFQERFLKNRLPDHLVPQWVAAEKVRVGDYLLSSPFTPQATPSPITPSSDLAWLMGVYIGDGHKERTGRIGFTLSVKDDVERLTATMRKDLGLNATVKDYPTYRRVFACSQQIAQKFGDWFGQRSGEKHIPDFMFNGEWDIRALLSGLLDADGYYIVDEDRYVLNTISKRLAMQVWQIAVHLGHRPTIRAIKRHSGYPNAKQLYKVEWKQSKGRWHRNIWWNGYYVTPITQINSVDYHGPVHDLTVGEHHSYHLNGVIAHNCVGGYCDVVEQGNSIIYSLRDPSGHPHVTIELSPPMPLKDGEGEGQLVRQVQGKQNREPIEPYKKRIEQFFQAYQKQHHILLAEQTGSLDGEDMGINNVQDFDDFWETYKRNPNMFKPGVDIDEYHEGEYGLPEGSEYAPDVYVVSWKDLLKELAWGMVENNDYRHLGSSLDEDDVARGVYVLAQIEREDPHALLKQLQEDVDAWDWDNYETQFQYASPEAWEYYDVPEEVLDEEGNLNLEHPDYDQIMDNVRDKMSEEFLQSYPRFSQYLYDLPYAHGKWGMRHPEGQAVPRPSWILPHEMQMSQAELNGYPRPQAPAYPPSPDQFVSPEQAARFRSGQAATDRPLEGLRSARLAAVNPPHTLESHPSEFANIEQMPKRHGALRHLAKLTHFMIYADKIRENAKRALQSLLMRPDVQKLRQTKIQGTEETYGGYLAMALGRLEQDAPESYKLWPWLVREYRREIVEPQSQRVSEWLNHARDIIGQGGKLLADMRQHNRLPQGFDINQMGFEQFAQWIQEENDKRAGSQFKGHEVVHEITQEQEMPDGSYAQVPNGWTIQQVSDPEDLALEGKLQAHCVGGYASSDSTIYSLRDPNNLPHVTVEVNPEGHVVQIQGKANSEPKDAYRDMLNQWFESSPQDPYGNRISDWARSEDNYEREWNPPDDLRLQNEKLYYPEDVENLYQDLNEWPWLFHPTETWGDDGYGYGQWEGYGLGEPSTPAMDPGMPEAFPRWETLLPAYQQALAEGQVSPQQIADVLGSVLYRQYEEEGSGWHDMNNPSNMWKMFYHLPRGPGYEELGEALRLTMQGQWTPNAQMAFTPQPQIEGQEQMLHFPYYNPGWGDRSPQWQYLEDYKRQEELQRLKHEWDWWQQDGGYPGYPWGGRQREMDAWQRARNRMGKRKGDYQHTHSKASLSDSKPLASESKGVILITKEGGLERLCGPANHVDEEMKGDPDYAFVYFRSTLEMTPWQPHIRFSELAEAFFKKYNYEIEDIVGRQDDSQSFTLGEVYVQGDSFRVSFEQPAPLEINKEAIAAIGVFLDKRDKDWDKDLWTNLEEVAY